MRLTDLDLLLYKIKKNPEASEALIKLIEDSPIIKSEVKQGTWKKVQCYICSECGTQYTNIEGNFNYCPNCGAKMF